MITKLKITLVAFICSFVFLFNLDAANFHILLVGDTKSNLKEQSEADLRMMHAQVQELSQAIGMSPQIHVLTESNVNRQEILHKIDRLKITRDDLILFYYSGHGCSSEQKTTPWPYLYLADRDQYMALDEVLDHLKNKNAKFALVVADCCNNFRGEMPQPTVFRFHSLAEKHISRSVKNLFLNSKGILVITGAEPGGYSWASDEGGILTSAFLDGLSPSEFYPSKTWHDLMREVIQKTKGIQKPQYAHYEE